MYRRSLLALAALSMLSAPVAQAQAQSRFDGPRLGAHSVQPRVATPQRHQVQRQAPPRSQFRVGQRFGNWQRQPAFRDYRRYNLRAPARGHHWVRAGNEFLLISASTGQIVSVAVIR